MKSYYSDDRIPQNSQANVGSVPVGSDEIYADYLQEERVKNIIAQTSPDNQLTDIEWRIRGYKKNNATGQWEKVEKSSPEPSALLVSRYIAYLSSLLNDNVRFTNLSSGEINAVMGMAIEWLVDDLDTNAEEYGLENNFSERTRIGNIILNQTFFCLKRAQNGMESKRIWNSLKVDESLNPQQNKKGVMDALKFWK